MSEEKVYYWTYEKSYFDTSECLESSFSIGIFQWIPKAGGKGLKKSKTIRVKGYVAESDKAYAKADEICERLNKESVRYGEFPSWVKQQFSVAKPQSLIQKPKETNGTLNSAQFRRIRKRVMKKLLEPLGYEVPSTTIAKFKSDSYMSIIEFQGSTKSPKYTINIGVHYPGLKSKSSAIPNCQDVFDTAYCYIFNYRIDSVKDGLDKWFEYCSSQEDAELQIRAQLDICLDSINNIIKMYPNAQAMINSFPPEKLTNENIDKIKLNCSLSIRDLSFSLSHYCHLMNMSELKNKYISVCESHLGTASKAFEDGLQKSLDSIK